MLSKHSKPVPILPDRNGLTMLPLPLILIHARSQLLQRKGIASHQNKVLPNQNNRKERQNTSCNLLIRVYTIFIIVCTNSVRIYEQKGLSVEADPHRTTSRILDILETVSLHQEGISLSEIAKTLGIPKSSIHPILATLADRNYLKANKREQRYTLGENLFVLGNTYVNESNILDKIKEVLLHVAEKTSETLYFGVLSNLDVLYLIKADQFSNFRVVSNPGNTLPAYSTGYGKALLSQFSPNQICSLYPSGTLQQITANTLSTVAALNDQLEEIRKTGFSYEKGESTTGIQCVAVPIRSDNKVLAGVSIAVPVFRYDSVREKEFKAYLLDAKQEIEQIITDNRSQWNFS